MIKLISRWTWELPQTLLGLLIFACHKIIISDRQEFVKDGSVYYTSTNSFGISLGFFIFGVSQWKYEQLNYPPEQAKIESEKTISHEFGHSIQSRILGPFYLLVVGLPSLVFNVMTRMGYFKLQSYYSRFPENWADKLGKVKR